jgi:hypothetical protein
MKTIKAYINAIDKITPSELKGFSSLSHEVQDEIISLSAEISNYFSEIKRNQSQNKL